MKKGFVFRRVIRLPLDAPPVHGHASALPALAHILRMYESARDSLCTSLSCATPDYYFQLPDEPRLLTRHMSAWVSVVLDELGMSAPAGFAYLGHSLRSGGSSAAEAIGVPRFRRNWLGGWSQSGRTRELHYLDPSILPTPAAYALLGWLLDSHYVAEHTT